MLIETKEQYEKIPDETICRVYLTGDGWEGEQREQKCLKIGNRLYCVSGFFNFEERNDQDDLNFIVCHHPEDRYEY